MKKIQKRERSGGEQTRTQDKNLRNIFDHNHFQRKKQRVAENQEPRFRYDSSKNEVKKNK